MKYKLIIPIGLIFILVVSMVVISQGGNPIPDNVYRAEFNRTDQILYSYYRNLNDHCKQRLENVGMYDGETYDERYYSRRKTTEGNSRVVAQWIYDTCIVERERVTTTTISGDGIVDVNAYER